MQLPVTFLGMLIGLLPAIAFAAPSALSEAIMASSDKADEVKSFVLERYKTRDTVAEQAETELDSETSAAIEKVKKKLDEIERANATFIVEIRGQEAMAVLIRVAKPTAEQVKEIDRETDSLMLSKVATPRQQELARYQGTALRREYAEFPNPMKYLLVMNSYTTKRTRFCEFFLPPKSEGLLTSRNGKIGYSRVANDYALSDDDVLGEGRSWARARYSHLFSFAPLKVLIEAPPK